MITILLDQETAQKFKINANFDDEEFKRLVRKENLTKSGDLSKTIRRIRDAVHFHNDGEENNYRFIKMIIDEQVNTKYNLIERLNEAKKNNDEEAIRKATEKLILKDYFSKIAKLEGKAVREVLKETKKVELEEEPEQRTPEEPKQIETIELKAVEELQKEPLQQEIEEEKNEVTNFIESVENAKKEIKTKSPQESLELFKWLNYNAENFIEVITEEDREKLENCQEEMKEIIKTFSKLLGVEYRDPIEEKEKEIEAFEKKQNEQYNEFKNVLEEAKELSKNFDKKKYIEINQKLKKIPYNEYSQQPKFKDLIEELVNIGNKLIDQKNEEEAKKQENTPAPKLQETPAQKIEVIQRCEQHIQDCFKEIEELPQENLIVDVEDWRIQEEIDLEKKALEQIPKVTELFENACKSTSIEEQKNQFEQLIQIFGNHFEKIFINHSQKLKIFKRAFVKMLVILDISINNRICLKEHIFKDTSKIQNNACLTNTQEILKEKIQNTEIEENKGFKTNLQVIHNITQIQENPKQPEKIKHTVKLLKQLKKENKKVSKTMKNTFRYILRNARKRNQRSVGI